MSTYIFKPQLEDYKKELFHKKEISERDGLIGIDSGFEEFNEITKGLKKQEYILIGARPSMGKTSFSTQLIINAMKQGKKNILYFSLEMSKETIISRLLAQHCSIPLSSTLYGESFDLYSEEIEKALEDFEDIDLYIEDFSVSKNSMENIERIAEEYEKEKGHIDLIIIDYIQLVNLENAPKTMSPNQKIDEISKRFVNIKKQMNCPLIALSQLSRELEKRVDKRPIMSDLRDSGSLEQDADLIVFLYKHDVYLEKTLKAKYTTTLDPLIEIQLNEIKNKSTNDVELIISKNRNGPLGNINVKFIKESTSFIDIHQKFDNNDANDTEIEESDKQNVDIDELFNDIYEEE